MKEGRVKEGRQEDRKKEREKNNTIQGSDYLWVNA